MAFIAMLRYWWVRWFLALLRALACALLWWLSAKRDSWAWFVPCTVFLAYSVYRLVRFAVRLRPGNFKALHLLMSHLTPAQQRSFVWFGRIRVTGSNGRRYLICNGRIGNVKTKTRTYCAHPSPAEHLPVYDALLAQKLLLEANAWEFLRVANVILRRHYR